MPIKTFERLAEYARVTGKKQYAIVGTAIEKYLDENEMTADKSAVKKCV